MKDEPKKQKPAPMKNKSSNPSCAGIGPSLEDYDQCRFIAFKDHYPAPEDLLKNLKYEYLRRELWVPLEHNQGKITVIVDDPHNILKRDMIESLLKTKNIDYCGALKSDILNFIDFFYGVYENPTSPRSHASSKRRTMDHYEEAPSVTESDSEIVQLVNRMIQDACLRRASDIHIEPDTKEHMIHVRFRIDGECLAYKSFPFQYRAAIISRIKIMSNLDITERRLPQDGKIKYERPGMEDIELRVATVPTHGYVEDVVLRILTKGEIMTLEQINMSSDNYDQFVNILKKPYGLILIVGPTGSGKTTTAHAALHLINKPNLKIWTAEDPVEITQKGLRQVQVHHKIGFDFSNAMRAFLRADPDVILVGEMRDYETAKMGIEASATGHLVMSTLHTNNAPETIVRLLDMGIDPFAFADSLLCVLAQRLVRILCRQCREPYQPMKEEWDELARLYDEKLFSHLPIANREHYTFYRPKNQGCADCNHTGYRGRMGIYELLAVTDSIKHMIVNRKSILVMRKAAVAEGMRTLLQDGILKVLQGETDLTEVLSVCIR